MKKNGFVMIETIIVLSVLSVGLIILYSSYSILVSKVAMKSNYDNPIYMYRAFFIKDLIKGDYLTKNVYDPYFNNNEPTETFNKDSYILELEEFIHDSENEIILDTFNLENIYLTEMITNLDESLIKTLEGSLINYIRSLNDYESTDNDYYRLIFKFNDGLESTKKTYYASLKIPKNK